MHSIVSNRNARKIATLLAVVATCFTPTARAQTANTFAPVVTVQTLVNGSLHGSSGGIAIDRFGNVFVASTFGNFAGTTSNGNGIDAVYEFPANGSAPLTLVTGSTAGFAGISIDKNQNLYFTTIYNPPTAGDSTVYEIPLVNGAYATNASLGSSPGACTATSTTLCSYGNFLGITGGYYQGYDIAIDGNGAGYFITAADSTGKNNIYTCSVSCATGAQAATIFVGNLPNRPTSVTADAKGNVFYSDGSSTIYEVPAGTSTPMALGAGFSQAIGAALDQAGNLVVTDSQAGYEIPLVNGGYNTAKQFKLFLLAGSSPFGYNGGRVGVDIHGNIYAGAQFANLFKFNVNNALFAPAAANSGNSTVSFTVVLNSATTGLTITSAGAQAGEFTTGTSTCTAGGALGGTCTFTGTFTPAGIGLRRAALIVTDASGNAATVTVAGVGQGAGITIDPGTIKATGTGFSSAADVAIDRAGNSYISDTTANAVYRYAAGTGTRTYVGSGLVGPTGVATDGAGNVYLADTGGISPNKGRIVQVPVVAGIPNTAAQVTIATGLGAPQGLFVDALGTVYVADSTMKSVFAIPPTQFGQAGGASYGSGLSGPTDVVVDSSGNLYIADPPANQVIGMTVEGVQSLVGSGLKNPTGVALDASGSVIIADQGNKRVVRVPSENGVLSATDEVTIVTSIGSPYAVRSDASGSLVVSDNTANVLDSINRTVGSIAFPSVNVNTTSSAQGVTLSSSGSQGLALNSPLFTPPATPFSLVQGKPACTAGTTLNAGFSCALSATFSPTSKNTYTASVAFSTSAANTSSPALTLSGTGLFLATPTVTLQQTSPAGMPTFGQTLTLTATVAGTAANGGTPTGSVALVIDGATQSPVPLMNGAAVLAVTGQSGGQHTYSINYLGDSNYAATASANLQITFLQLSSTTTLAITADAVSPLSAAAGDTVTFSSTITPSGPGFFSGTVNYVSNSATLATATVTAGTGGTYTATATSNTLQPGTYQVTAVYSGNANFSTSSSAPVTLIIVATPTIVVTPAATTIVSAQNAPGSTLLTITSYAAFQGAVDFACSGLPAHATCVFNPALVTVQSNGSSPLTVPVQTTTLSILVDQAPLTTPTAIYPWTGLFLLLGLLRLRRVRSSWRLVGAGLASLALTIIAGGGIIGCGSTDFVTPTGSSTITVTATATPSTPGTPASNSNGTVTSSFSINLKVQ